MNTCTIIDYSDEHHGAFKSLNIEWLEKYNLLESHDIAILDDPRTMILNHGGVIFLAQCDNKIVGTAALINEGHGIFELVKMAVHVDYRKNGISKLLIEKCLDHARRARASKIILFSNHKLQAALNLYEKYGFQHVPVIDSPFETADVRMELSL